MTQQQIEGNEIIAKFIGAKKKYFLIYKDGKPWKHFGEKISDTQFNDVPFNDHIHQSGRNMTNYPVLQQYAWQMKPTDENPVYDNWLKYHSSWDWLMPVVIKINKMDKMVNINFWSHMSTTECKIYNWDLGDPEQTHECENPIESVWTTVVNFIKWYNQQHSI